MAKRGDLGLDRGHVSPGIRSEACKHVVDIIADFLASSVLPCDR